MLRAASPRIWRVAKHAGANQFFSLVIVVEVENTNLMMFEVEFALSCEVELTSFYGITTSRRLRRRRLVSRLN